MSLSLRKDFYFIGILFLLAVILFGTHLGGFGLMDPDEPFYSLTAKEMLQRGDWSTPVIFGSPQFEKPIFFYWVLCACFKIFGISEWAARLGPCLAGIFTVLVTYLWGRVLFRRPEAAFASAAILATAAEFVVVSRVVLTDSYLCLFVTAALYFFSLGYFKMRYRKVAWNLLFVFSALAFLSKGLLGIILPLMAIILYLCVNGQTSLLLELPWVSGGLLFGVIGLPWYGLMTVKYGPSFLTDFFVHENIRRFFVAEHGSFDRFYFYPAGIFLGFFPWSFALPFGLAYSFKKASRGGYNRKPFLFLGLAFVSFFIFFMCAKSKLLSYVFPLFPLIALIMGGWGFVLARAVVRKMKLSASFLGSAFVALGIMPVALAAGTYFFGRHSKIQLVGPVLIFSLTVLVLSWGALFFLWKKKAKSAFLLILLSSVAFSLVTFGILLPRVDTLFASRDFVETYLEDSHGETPKLFIAGKLFVRGVSFYSGNKKMAVLTDDPRGSFYTKHSIPMISSTEDLLALSANNFPAYCFLRKKEAVYLKKIVDNHFKMTVLDDRPQRTLIRLERV